jgi:putative ABC transport system permease protein
MSFWKIAWRNIQQRALASSLTGLSMALGVAAMICVIVIHSVAVRQFSPDTQAQGYHVIVGGKGGSLQLVLSTVFYLGQPLYPIPYSYYEKFKDGGEFANVTEVAVPICLGDSYVAPDGQLFRVVATTPDLFDKIQYGTNADGSPKSYTFRPGGRNFQTENFFEAVVGSIVAAQSGLKVGDEINPTHGIGSEGHKHDAFEVVGILQPTGTANDGAVFINMEGFYLLEGHALSAEEEDDHDHETEVDAHEHAAEEEHFEHDHETAHDHTAEAHENEAEHDHAAEHDHDAEEHEPEAEHDHAAGDHDHEHAHNHDHAHSSHEPLPIAQREVTSILVLCNSPFGPTVLDTAVNKGEDRIAQSVAPARVVTMLLDSIVGPVRVVLMVLTVLIVIVAGISILVSIYNSMSERSHDIAVMRALGASRGAVMSIILVESILLSLLGGLAGILLGHGIIALASPLVEARTGMSLGVFQFDWQEIVLIPGLVVLASLVGLLPAVAAYRTDVAKSLGGSR